MSDTTVASENILLKYFNPHSLEEEGLAAAGTARRSGYCGASESSNNWPLYAGVTR